jgi:hypothetical protein
MLKSFLFCILLICAGFASAYGEQTLAGSRLQVHGNIAPSAGITTGEQTPVFLAGARWSALINHSFLLGCGFYGTPFTVKAPSGEFRITYGGPIIGWVFFSDKILHFSLECLAGTGTVWYPGDGVSDRPFLVVVPGGSLELNVTSHFHIALSGGYRFGFNAPEAGGIVGEIQLKFGDF